MLSDQLSFANSQKVICHSNPWPNSAPFALFLSHDIDQIHDREMWRILADVNHIRRVAFSDEPGSIWPAMRRIGRALFCPKPAARDFETILEIEGRYSFRSTFFILYDRYWARHGARFRLSDPEIRAIVNLIQSAGGEIAVHGGYYHFNDPAAYRESRMAIAKAFGVEPVGIRNHLLRFSGDLTWRAQQEAGFAYDATFGNQSRPGPTKGRVFPFWAVAPGSDGENGLVEISLTVMDGSLFRHRRLSGEAALDAAWASVAPVIEIGGLVTLLWHSNYFNEPEYWDWQWVYEQLLERLATLNPWCATGAEINAWWRALQGVQLQTVETNGGWEITVKAAHPIDGLVLDVAAPAGASVLTDRAEVKIGYRDSYWQIVLPSLKARDSFRIMVQPAIGRSR